MKLTVIVPMLNEERKIESTLNALRKAAGGAEIIVVDGGSNDASIERARPLCNLFIRAPRGRARQMNAGAARADGDVLAFVHADTIVPADFEFQIEQVVADPQVVGGHFDLLLDDSTLPYRLLGAAISRRSRLMRSATGDQAIFVRRATFEELGGYAEIELCEDVDFMRRLRAHGRIACAHAKVITSARRWRRNGFLRTIARMWLIKSLFLLGISPAWLMRRYSDAR